MNLALTLTGAGPTLGGIPAEMAPKQQLTACDVPGSANPVLGSSCQCLADFFREEFLKHHACLERQREYYSDVAISQAEEALARIMAQLEQLCQRDDACQMVGELLKKFDLVTKLSMWTETGQLH
jgi:hypothetical protein